MKTERAAEILQEMKEEHKGFALFMKTGEQLSFDKDKEAIIESINLSNDVVTIRCIIRDLLFHVTISDISTISRSSASLIKPAMDL